MEFTIEIKMSIDPDQAHLMKEVPEMIQDRFASNIIRINSVTVTNDTLVAEENK